MAHQWRRHSILTRYAVVTGLALVIAAVVSYAIGAIANEGVRFNSCVDSANYLQQDLVDYWSTKYTSDTFSSADNDAYKDLRKHMRDMCQNLDAEHVYIYKVNEERTERSFLLIVASNNKADEEASSYEIGVGSDVPFSSEELRTLDGETVDTPESVRNDYEHDYCWYRLVSLPNGDGNVILGVDFDIGEVDAAVQAATLSFAVPLIIAVGCIALFELVLLRRNIVIPIRAVSASMRTFVVEGTHEPVPIKSNRDDEISEITASFNQMATDIEQHVSRIEEMAEERVATETEMQVAKRIQQGFVPATTHKEDPCLGYELHAFERTARAVGGDFYDVGELDDGRLFFVIADVSGKGVSAALFMAVCLTLLHDKLAGEMSPAEALNVVNDAIVSNNPEDMFVTTIACLYDPATHVLTYANAGHTPPLIVGGDYLNPDPGIALGMFEDAGIVDDVIPLEPNTGVVFYTDGATEANNAQKEFFGEKRLADAVANAHTAQEAVDAVVHAVDDFVGGAEQFDDLTLISFFRHEQTALHWEDSFEPDLSYFKRIRDHLITLCDSKDAAKRPILACDEAFTNVVSYSGATAVEVAMARQQGHLEVRLSDDGIPFDPLNREEVEVDFEDLAFGGMGISFIKQVCSELSYEYKNGKNVLTMGFEL